MLNSTKKISAGVIGPQGERERDLKQPFQDKHVEMKNVTIIIAKIMSQTQYREKTVLII